MTLGRSTALVSALTFACYALGFFVQVLFARAFGAGPSTDAWFAAVAVPTFLATVLFLSLVKAALPVFVAEWRERRNAAFRTVWGLFLRTLLGLLVVAGAVAAGIDPVVRTLFPDFGPERAEAARRLLGIAVWSVPATGAALILMAVQQGVRRFGYAAASTILQPAGVLAALILLKKDMGIDSMAVGLVAGSWAQLLVLLPPMLRRGRFRPTLAPGDAALREIRHRFQPLLLAAAPLAAYPLLEKLFASALPAGQVSWLDYGRRPLNLLLVLVAAPVGITTYTAFAEAAADGDLAGLRSRAWRTTVILFLVLLPAGIFLAVHAEELVRIVYERGRFEAGDTRAAAVALRLLLPAAVLGAVGKILLDVFTARGRMMVPVVTSLAGVAVYLAAGSTAAGFFEFRGLALLASASAGLGVFLGVVALVKSLGAPRGERVIVSLAQILAAGALSCGALLLTADVVPGRDQPLLVNLAVLGALAVVSAGIYLGALSLFRNPHLAEVLSSLTSSRRAGPPPG